MASPRRMRLPAAAVTALVALYAAGPASAALTPTITEFSDGLTGDVERGITAGPDGNVWFAGSTSIGRITPSGAITEFSAGLNAGASPQVIAAGPDGNLWFTDNGTTKAIGRITPSGSITEFSAGLNAGSAPSGITAGPDGNLWFTDPGTTNAIGRITPSGTIIEFSAGLGPASHPESITLGSDGNLWFSDSGSPPAVGRVTPAGVITEFTAGLGGTNPYGIASGDDGNVWFSDSTGNGVIGRVTPSGGVTNFADGMNAGATPYFIAAGDDGSLWFTDEGTTAAIGRITTAGEIEEFSSGLGAGSTPFGISPGPDGNVWFTDAGTPDAIGRITTPPTADTGAASVLGAGAAEVSGVVKGHSQATSYVFEHGSTDSYGAQTSASDAGSGSADVTASAELSGLDPNTTYHYRLSATNPTGTSTGADATFTTLALPSVDSLRVKPKTWRLGSELPEISGKTPVGTKIIFTLSRAVPVRLEFSKRTPGRKVSGKCRRPTRKNRERPKCTRLKSAGTLSFSGHPGKNRVRFEGRISKKRELKPGRYQLKVIAADPTTTRTPSRKVSFRIARG